MAKIRARDSVTIRRQAFGKDELLMTKNNNNLFRILRKRFPDKTWKSLKSFHSLEKANEEWAKILSYLFITRGE